MQEIKTKNCDDHFEAIHFYFGSRKFDKLDSCEKILNEVQ